MSGKKCKHCGSSEIEVDPARGDAVCTNCGSVLEDNIIVAEVEFQENAHGGASAIGQFVSAESKGGASGFGRAFNAGIGQESREITLRKAREGITALCQQLRLNQQCIDIACNFFKMALARHLTIGRQSALTQAACVYITCRTEGTAHLLIDISDALQIDCYQLGRTYFKLSKALCINIPPTVVFGALTASAHSWPISNLTENAFARWNGNSAICWAPAVAAYKDPCLYIIRFASQLQFDDKQHEVSMTALRLVQRMKRDSIHSGRRPSGVCGAALLIAARLHDFSRTPTDVVRIVKIHETTLRKRLLEFGETPSSALTLDEFMTVDLEEEQDPPAFKVARRRDKDRLQKLMEEEDGERELTELQREIDTQLDKDKKRRKSSKPPPPPILSPCVDDSLSEDAEATRFAAEDTLSLIGDIARDAQPNEEATTNDKLKLEKGLGPEIAFMGLNQSEETQKTAKPDNKQFSKDLQADELHLDDDDEQYLDSLIMTADEARHKTLLWHNINAGYLKEQKIKEEIRAKEREEGKDKKKKVRGSYKKKVAITGATAGEAVGKMLAEKKMSSKINYDILKSLDQPGTPSVRVEPTTTVVKNVDEISVIQPPVETVPASPVPKKRKRKEKAVAQSPAPATPSPATPAPAAPSTPAHTQNAEDYEDDFEADAPEVRDEMSLAALLQNGEDDDYYDYEEY